MPTDTSVKFLHSAMVGAPVLTGQAGSLIALLDACLVNGFGTGGVDGIVIAGGVATVTRSAGHPFDAESVTLIAGATVSGGTINGERKVLASPAPTATTYCFDATGIPNQTATGSITHKVAPLGWSKVFAGTNLAVYKPTDPAATGCVLRVDDTGTVNARVVGYESMTDVNTGSGLFPTSAQVSGGGFWPKSNAADATARPWILAGDSRFFCLPVAYTAASPGAFGMNCVFGDLLPVKSPDPYACVLNAFPSTSFSTAGSNNTGDYDYGDTNATAACLYLARAYTGLGVAVAARKAFPVLLGSSGARSGAAGLPYPNYADGGLYVAQHYLCEAAGVYRGMSPGLYCSQQVIGAATFGNRDSISSIAGLAGRKLRAVNSNSGVFFIDVTGPWR